MNERSQMRDCAIATIQPLLTQTLPTIINKRKITLGKVTPYESVAQILVVQRSSAFLGLRKDKYLGGAPPLDPAGRLPSPKPPVVLPHPKLPSAAHVFRFKYPYVPCLRPCL